MRLAGIAKGGFYPTPERVVNLITPLVTIDYRSTVFGPKSFRILDPCCGTGEAVADLAAGLNYRHPRTVVEIYGVELEQERAKAAEDQVDFVMQSDLFQTQIANKAFSMLYLNPPYDFHQEEKRVEHAFLTHCTKQLATDGLLIFVVPQHRLSVSARFLAANYYNINCFAFPKPEYDDFDQVVLFANKREHPLTEPVQTIDKIQSLSRRVWEGMAILEEGIGTVATAPVVLSGPLLFTARALDPVAAAKEARESGLWTSTALHDRFWPSQVQRTRPLMPLRKGHMAQLIAAGFLDNLILESGESRIVVKGTTRKESVLVSEDKEKGVQVWQDKMRTVVTTVDLDTGVMEDIRA